MSVYKLKGTSFATCTRTVITTLEEVGAKYELEVVDLAVGEQKTPEYVAQFQPFGQIPVLIDGDFKLFESRAIIRYIADKHAADSLYPKDLKKRAIVEQWLSVNQSNNGPVTDIVIEFIYKPFGGVAPDVSKVPAFTEKLNAYLAILEKHLASNAYFAGDEVTLADISFLSFFECLLQIPAFSNAFDGFTHLKKWWENVSSRPSWKKATGKN